MSVTLNEEQIQKAFHKWLQAVSKSDLETLLSLYDPGATLKPTLSTVIRVQPQELALYFKGGEKYKDMGFLKLGIDQAEILESYIQIFEKTAVNQGVYEFFKDGESLSKAHFTFVYHLSDEGEVKIVAHHSSLHN